MQRANGMALPKAEHEINEWSFFPATTGSDFEFGKSTEPLAWFFAEVNERVESRVDSTWIRIVANPDNISES